MTCTVFWNKFKLFSLNEWKFATTANDHVPNFIWLDYATCASYISTNKVPLNIKDFTLNEKIHID